MCSSGKALAYLSSHFFTDAGGNRGRAPNVGVVLLDGWPTDKVEEASRQARESGINILFVTIEGPTEYEKENVLEANFMDEVKCPCIYLALSSTGSRPSGGIRHKAMPDTRVATLGTLVYLTS